MDGRIQIVIQIAEIFKNSRLIVRLRKQIVDVKKLNALRIAPVSEIADAVRVHDLIGYRVLRGMGLAVTFVMGLASAICWVVDTYVLQALNLGFLQTLTFILVLAALVQFVEMFLKKSIPSLYSALGIYLPLITTNCAVLGVVLLNVQNKYNFLESVVYGITGGLGFLLAIFALTVITTAEISIMLCYFQLANEDYHWWWRSFANTGSTAFFVFLFAIYYMISIGITQLVSGRRVRTV